MSEQKANLQKKRVLESDAENERREKTGAQDSGNVLFSSGRNRGMAAQRSNRQGSGLPTQQKVGDR